MHVTDLVLQNGYETRFQEVIQMTSFLGFEPLQVLIGDRKHRLIQEAEQERLANQARRPADSVEPERQRFAVKSEPEWGPWLQGGEPLHLSHAGPGLS